MPSVTSLQKIQISEQSCISSFPHAIPVALARQSSSGKTRVKKTCGAMGSMELTSAILQCLIAFFRFFFVSPRYGEQIKTFFTFLTSFLGFVIYGFTDQMRNSSVRE